MRVLDRALPPFSPHDPSEAIMPWPAHVHFVLEGAPSPPWSWDQPDAEWGDADLVWDDIWRSSQYSDAVCDLAGMDIQHGPPDALGLFPAGHLAATLVDPDGRYGRFNANGTMTDYQLGRRVYALAELDGEWLWLFAGRVTAWVCHADDTVTVEAYNAPSELSPRVGTYTPGVAGQRAAARLLAILSATNHGPMAVGARFDTGTVALTAQATPRAPWEEMQVVTLSDGGLLAADADDFLTYRDRTWPTGRTDQTAVPVVSDNDCTAPYVVWNADLSTNDDTLVAAVHLVNVPGLIADKAAPSDGRLPTRPTLTHPQPDQWTTQVEGDTLATLLLNRRSLGQVQVESFQMYLDDPHNDWWRLGIDVRLGDRLMFWHRYRNPDGSTPRITLGLIVQEVRHSITPHAWVVTVGTSRAVDFLDYTDFWDSGLTWDDPALVWDANNTVPI